MPYSSRQGKGDSMVLQIIYQGCLLGFSRSDSSFLGVWPCLTVTVGPEGGTAALAGPYGAALSQRGLFLILVLLDFWTCLEPVIPLSFQFLLLQMGPSLLYLSLLYFGSMQLTWFHRFTAGDIFCVCQDEYYHKIPIFNLQDYHLREHVGFQKQAQ